MNKKPFALLLSSFMMFTFAFGIIIVPQPVDSLTITVDDDGPANYAKIQDAINASSDGDTVFVFSGTYFENLVVNRSINLTGEGQGTTFIVSNSTDYAIYVIANWVNITGFTVRNATVGGIAGIMLYNVSNCLVYNNTALENEVGIRLYSSSDCAIFRNNASVNGIGISTELSKNITISENHIKQNDYGVYSIGSENINVSGNIIQFSSSAALYLNSTNFTASENGLLGNYYGFSLDLVQKGQITKNIVTESTRSGIFARGSLGCTIEYNDFTSNGEQGIFLSSCTSSEIKNNYIYNSSYGIALDSSSQITMDGNELSEDFDAIYLYYSPDNIITNNSVNSSGESAITLIFSSSSTVAENNVALSDFYGLYINGSSGCTIYHNSIIDNVYQAYDDGNANTWDSGYPQGGNFWSDYLGFDNFSGANQDVPGSDGLGDTFYEIDSDSRDRYPLLDPTQDTLAPRIFLLSPANNSFINSSTSLDFYIFEGNLDSVQYSTDGSSWDELSFPYTVMAAGFTEGPLTVWVKANDTQGNTAQNSFQFTLDSTLPEIQLISPANNSAIRGGTKIHLLISDLNQVHTNYSLDSLNHTPLPPSYEIDTTNWPDGEHIISVEAIDEAGNKKKAQFAFILDTSPPSVTEMGVMVFPGETQGSANISLNVTDSSGVLGVWIEIHDPFDVYLGNFSADYDAVGQKFFLNRSFTVVGTYNVVIWAADNLGNWISGPDSFDIVLLATEPRGLKAQGGDLYVLLSWSLPNSTGGLPLNGFRIYKGQVGVPGFLTINIGNFTQYNDTDVVNGNTYYYQVGAITDAGLGPLSDEKSAKPQGTTQGPSDPSKPKGFPDWILWLILIIIVLFAILFLLLLKKKSDETRNP